MTHIIYKIYKLETNPSTNELDDLIIGGKIKFLREILLNNCQFKRDVNNDWILKFFVGKNYEQSFLISKNLFRRELCLSTSSLIIGKDDFNNNDAEILSSSVRENKSLKITDFTEYPSHYSHIDGKGISFFSKLDGQREQFERHIILQSLAYAYLGAIEFIANKLAEKINCHDCNINELNELYIEAAKFNSMFFFHQPVLSKNTSLTETWKCIDKALDVNVSSNELLGQLSNVHYILNLEAEKEKAELDNRYQAKQDKLNTRFTIIGIIIGLLSLIELFK